jgi:hypothetical protein
MIRSLVCCILVSLGGCASVHSVSLSSVPRDRARPITSESHDWSFLGINFQNEFVDKLEPDLRKQCPSGAVAGVYTRYETVMYVVVMKRQVRVSAFCVPPPPPPAPPEPAPPPAVEPATLPAAPPVPAPPAGEPRPSSASPKGTAS